MRQLNTTTIHDDATTDKLTGSSDRDWFFANLVGGVLDQITDWSINDRKDDIN